MQINIDFFKVKSLNLFRLHFSYFFIEETPKIKTSSSKLIKPLRLSNKTSINYFLYLLCLHPKPHSAVITISKPHQTGRVASQEFMEKVLEENQKNKKKNHKKTKRRSSSSLHRFVQCAAIKNAGQARHKRSILWGVV